MPVIADALPALLGLDGRLGRRAVARDLAAARSEGIPPVLRVSWLPDGTVALAGYSEPVAEVRRRLREEEQSDFSDEVLLELYRQRVLVPPPAVAAERGLAGAPAAETRKERP